MKQGKKGKAWTKTRASLKKIFEKQGIYRCEVCGLDNLLSFAHRMKRRFITTQEELETVALLCIPCHARIEALPHQEMFDRVTEIINKRNFQRTI